MPPHPSHSAEPATASPLERSLCPACLRPLQSCYCALVERIDTRTKVLILQHPRERRVGVNTARIAHLCLPNSELRHGIDFSHDLAVRRALADPHRRPILLFPGSDAVDVREHPPLDPVTLIVLDGTWWQASKLLKRNAELAALPRYSLTPDQPSRYLIRREPAEHCVSTIEALVQVLGLIEGEPERLARMLRPFETMVAWQLAWTASNAALPSRHAIHRDEKPTPFSQWLRGPPEAIILAAGEANDWPRAAHAGAPELVHWAAIRPATGARFEAFVRPVRQLAPSCPRQIEVPREVIEAGESFDVFAARWRDFRRDGDLVCMWGKHAGDAGARDGLSLELRLDLRPFAISHLGRRAGALEDYPVALGVAAREPWARGRAGRKLAALEAIAPAMSPRLR